MSLGVVFDAEGHAESVLGANIMLTSIEIHGMVMSLVKDITMNHQHDYPLFIVLMDGAVKFATDLTFNLQFPLEIAYLEIKSYVGQFIKGEYQIGKVPLMRGRNVIILDDICDTGGTLVAARQLAILQGASTVKTCALLLRPDGAFTPDYFGTKVEKFRWVFGYGMDYKYGQLRHLPYIAFIMK